MMSKAVTAARQPDADKSGADATYRNLFDSFNPDSSGRISPLEVLSPAGTLPGWAPTIRASRRHWRA